MSHGSGHQSRNYELLFGDASTLGLGLSQLLDHICTVCKTTLRQIWSARVANFRGCRKHCKWLCLVGMLGTSLRNKPAPLRANCALTSGGESMQPDTSWEDFRGNGSRGILIGKPELLNLNIWSFCIALLGIEMLPLHRSWTYEFKFRPITNSRLSILYSAW